MKGISLLVLIAGFASTCSVQNDSFNGVNSSVAENRPLTNDQVQQIFEVANFELRLVSLDGRCMLISKLVGDSSKDSRREFDLNMASPCDFVRQPSKGYPPLSYSYQHGKDRRTVLLVTGGQPDANVTDEFQPAGCGTSLAKIRVFDNRIEVVWAGENGSPVCPSRGLEEIFFAA